MTFKWGLEGGEQWAMQLSWGRVCHKTLRNIQANAKGQGSRSTVKRGKAIGERVIEVVLRGEEDGRSCKTL